MAESSKMNSLEHVVHEKVEPMIEEAMQRFLGATINELEEDITEKIEQQPLIGLAVRTDLSFKKAKKIFKKEFLEQTIQTHYGNISEVADVVGLNRRSVHRDIKKLNVDIDKLRQELYKRGHFQKEAMDDMIRKTLENYKEIIHPEKLEEMYEYVPELSENIVRVLPLRDMNWKDAEKEFEKEYLLAVLEHHDWNISETARKIGLRYETVLRKIKKLNLREYRDEEE